MRLITVVLVASVLAMAPLAEAKKVKGDAGRILKIRHLATGNSSGIHESVIVAAGDAVAWQGLWDRHTANITPKPALPAVDFSKEMVIAVFDGDKPTGGYTLRIKKVVSTPKATEVKVATTSPSKGAATSQMVTQPYDIVATPKTDAPVQRQEYGSH
jgi:hypothetical protein